MERTPPQAPTLDQAQEKIFNLTITYIMQLVRETHKGVLQGLDDEEIHDLVIDAILRASQFSAKSSESDKVVRSQVDLVSYVSGLIPFLAQREKRRKTVRELRQISSGLIPPQMDDMVSDSTIPGDNEDFLHEETLALFGNDEDWHK